MPNAKEIVAMSKIVANNDLNLARRDLPVGRHEVDIAVRIHGSIMVFEDTDKTPTVSIPMKEVLALFIHHCGITRHAAINILQRSMTDALAVREDGAQDTHGQGAIAANMPLIDEVTRNVVNPLLATLPRTPVKGQVRARLEVEELETAAV